MKRCLILSLCLVTLSVVAGCWRRETRTLLEAKRGFQTQVVRQEDDREAVVAPPKGLFNLVEYKSPVGMLPAYLTPPTKDGKKHPAIIWITGGDSNSIGEAWGPDDPQNDQSARAFRQAGVVMLFPALRGGNTTTSRKESFFGEVDDVLAAADFLAKQPHVDPKRIFLGGHSTGGTLVLLVAESSNRFRAVFCFGPVSDVSGYGGQYLTCALTDQELRLRSPGNWLHGIKSPTFVFEGDLEGNGEDLQAMQRSNSNPQVHFQLIRGYSHFSILAPMNQKLAQSVAQDRGTGSFTLPPLPQ